MLSSNLQPGRRLQLPVKAKLYSDGLDNVLCELIEHEVWVSLFMGVHQHIREDLLACGGLHEYRAILAQIETSEVDTHGDLVAFFPVI